MTDVEGAPSLKMECVGGKKPKRRSRRPGAPPPPLPDEPSSWRGCCPPIRLAEAVKGLDADEIAGPGGLITRLAGRVIEAALGAELTEHLGYEHGQAPPGGAGNQRNGATAKR